MKYRLYRMLETVNMDKAFEWQVILVVPSVAQSWHDIMLRFINGGLSNMRFTEYHYYYSNAS